MEAIRIKNVRKYLSPSTSFEVKGINDLESVLMFTEVSAELMNDQIELSIKSARVTSDMDDPSSIPLWKIACSPFSVGKSVWLYRSMVKCIESWITISMDNSFLL